MSSETLADGRARTTSLRRTLFELVTVLAALCFATAVGAVASGVWPSGDATDARPAPFDPALVRGATRTNPCDKGEVALTFDDGPDVYTPQVLSVLAAYGARATFFVLGEKVAKMPDLARRLAAEGHRVENHTWDHPHLIDLTQTEIADQLSRTQAAIADAGLPTPRLLRPPFGDANADVEAVAATMNLMITRWDVDTDDWRGRSATDIVSTTLERLHPGAVILLHDGGRESLNTVRALPNLIRSIRARGYCTALMHDS